MFDYKHGFQAFPEAITSSYLLPYAAVTAEDGGSVFFTLSDKINMLNYQNGDFEIKINDVIIPDIISNVSIIDYDSSILRIELFSEIQLWMYRPHNHTDNSTVPMHATTLFFFGKIPSKRRV